MFSPAATFAEKAVTLSEADLIAKLSSLRGAKFITFVARTDCRLKKTGNSFGRVWKVSRVNVCVNFLYNEGVLRRLEKEGKSPDDFHRGESWHCPIFSEDGKLTPLCQHKTTGEFYVRCQLIAKVGESSYFTDDNVEVTEEEIAPYLPKKSTYANQGLDNPLIFLTYSLASIKEITCDGNTQTVSDN